MSKAKVISNCIPKIHRKQAEDVMLFAWINAQKQLVPSITLDQAICNFMRFTGVDWDLDSAKTNFTRTQKDFYEDTTTH